MLHSHGRALRSLDMVKSLPVLKLEPISTITAALLPITDLLSCIFMTDDNKLMLSSGILSMLQKQIHIRDYYNHILDQPVLADTLISPVRNWENSFEQCFTARLPLLKATSAFKLGIRRCKHSH